jgi:nicotinate-nucleotide adenylyltransferase|tara:strand:- start:370 stop:960 length:591 start_codon:yes stop_codon:yes gene_type:complete
MSRRKKICLFGGTFDPPHIGHLLVAQTIFEAENFDKIVFIPTFKTPRKNNISDIKDRLAMLRMGVTSNPNFEISDLEIQRGGTSYTIDTIREYKSDQNYDSRELYYLIGSDSLQTFHIWKEPREILDESQVIVALRPGFRPSDISNWILRKVRFANIPRFEISSSTIRSRWQENKTIRYMVTQPVWEYINDHGIYK